MKSATIFSLFSLAVASPVEKRQNQAGVNDAAILNYALTLEHLENAFYKGALARYSQADFAAAGFDATVYKNIVEIGKDEASHVSFLTQALSAAGANPVSPCTYNFPYNSVGAFMSLSKTLEGVGISAYLGAAANITTPAYLTAAASILTVESRHSAYVRAQLKLSPFPGAYDTPLGFNGVYTLAAGFITACPSTNVALPVKAYPSLSLTGFTQVFSGRQASFTTPATGLPASGAFVAFISGVSGPVFVPATTSGSTVTATVPSTMLDGQIYALLTRQGSGAMIVPAQVLAGPAAIELGLPGAVAVAA
ncbi:ferritin-like domain-domain-containing protein [Protomyces lactucae-debilis]|uniref:Ferritin-like domain-domain-containing protein n=1 Tax=Protomyces lactucae-debilis TaxID=2754530 RepID=A0A1Y2FJY8_PROLT|nr:ferritin-like domain-containing protein [Protomyces lactucae-debilis]ORY83897.1 ferritin-like domain-domain-containing protein [Protomyces lactucae-debilis]